MLYGLLLLAALQTPGSGASESAQKTDAAPLTIDILVKSPQPQCEVDSSDEIVVCADKADNEQHRLRPIADAKRLEKDESKAEFAIAENATMLAEGEAAGLGGGVQSNRIMMRIKIAF